MQNLLKALGDRRAQLADKGEAQKGFTLVELLVVVIIIGILAGIAIPVFLNQRTSAWKAEAESDAKNAALAAETFAVDNNGNYDDIELADLIGAGFEPSREGTDYVTVAEADGGDNFVITVNHPDLDENLEYRSADGGLQPWPGDSASEEAPVD